jgi:hypothetical protein
VDAVDDDDEIAQALRSAARTFISDFANIVRIGQASGHFAAGANADDVGEKLMSLCVGCGWTYRMTGEAAIFDRMQPAVEAIIRDISRKPAPARSAVA